MLNYGDKIVPRPCNEQQPVGVGSVQRAGSGEARTFLIQSGCPNERREVVAIEFPEGYRRLVFRDKLHRRYKRVIEE